MLCPALGAEAPQWLKVVLSAWPSSGMAKSKKTKQTPVLSHHLIALQLCYRAHTETGKVTLTRETPTVNHWLPGLFTHSLKSSPFKFDQYQTKSSQRATDEWPLKGHWASGKTEFFKWAAYAGELNVHSTHFYKRDTISILILHFSANTWTQVECCCSQMSTTIKWELSGHCFLTVFRVFSLLWALRPTMTTRDSLTN